MPASISEQPEFRWPFLDMMGEIGFSRMFEDYNCQRKIICEMMLLSDSSNSVQGRSKMLANRLCDLASRLPNVPMAKKKSAQHKAHIFVKTFAEADTACRGGDAGDVGGGEIARPAGR